MDARISSFTLILSMEFINQLMEFFVEQTVPQRDPKQVTASKSGTVLTEKQVPKQTEQMMMINLKVEKPEIVLVEHMMNIDTRALILNVRTFTYKL